MRYFTATFLVVLLSAATASAAPTPAKKSASLTVRATVEVACTLVTPAFHFDIGVGAIHAPGAAITNRGSLNVRCTKNSTTNIAMDTGLYGSKAGSQFGTRSMGSTDGHYLGYELCHDSACASVWTPAGYNYTSASDQGASLPVWTVIKMHQTQVKQDPYNDSVTVTVSF